MTDISGRLDILQLYKSAVEETDSPENLARNLREHIESQRRSSTDEAIELLIRLDRHGDAASKDIIPDLVSIQRKLDDWRYRDADQKGLAEIRGSLGFLAGSLNLVGGDVNSARQFFEDPDSLDFIHYWYGVPKAHLQNLQPFKFGTTSLIFRCGVNGENVLKLLQLKYFDDSSLAEPFSKYQEIFGNAPSAPAVHDCGRGWLLMEYIEGETLREFIDGSIRNCINKSSKPGASSSVQRTAKAEYFSLLQEISSGLLAVLEEMDNAGLSHFDLSPTNILVVKNDSRFRIRLIDFGVNNLLSRNIGSAREIGAAQAYASPELLEGNAIPVLSDVYSFGTILLECCVGSRIKETQLEGCLDDVWLRMPDLAMIVDDCLTRDAEFRALEYKSPLLVGNGGKYREVGSRGIYTALRPRLRAAVMNTEKHAKRSQIRELLSNSVNSGNYIKDIAEDMTGMENSAETEVSWELHDRKLDRWKKVCIFLFSLCAGIVPIAIFVHELDSLSIVEFARQGLGIESVSLLSSLPGRAVCLSFAFAATLYYINIFQSVDIYDGPEPDEESFVRHQAADTAADDRAAAQHLDEALKKRRTYKIARFWLRFNSFCFAIPILWALVLDPLSWPYCSALGLFFVGMNNHWIKRAALSARESLDPTFRVRESRSVDATMDLFSGWDRLVFYYAAGLIGIGLFFWYQRNVGKADIWSVELMFAAAAVFVNYVKMQRENCTKLAPAVRKMLLHIFLSHKRLNDARMYGIGFDEFALRLRSVTEWLQTRGRMFDVDAVLILADKRDDLDSYAKAMENEGVVVTWCGTEACKKGIEAKRILPTTIVVSSAHLEEMQE